MTLTKDRYSTPQTFLPPAVKDFLEGFGLGRIGLRVGRRIIQTVQALRVKRAVWIREIGLPLRNVMLMNRPLTVSINENPIRLAPHGQIASLFWTGREFEKHELTFVLSVLEPGMIFFDVGANVGLFAISAAKKIGGTGVYAFEPCSSTYELLNRNLVLNHVEDVSAFRVGLGSTVGQGVLQINDSGRDGLNTLGQATHPESRVVGQEKVPVTTVDVFMTEQSIPYVNVMKVDIEGGELMLLQGARNLLERPDAPLIFCEGGFLSQGFGYHPIEVLRLLGSCGYTLFALNGETGEARYLTADYQYDATVIAVKPSHAAYKQLASESRA